MAKGRSGSFRANSLTASDLSAMQNHELRLDLAGDRRSIRKTADGSAVPPLIHNPLGVETLTLAYAAHVKGAKVNKSAGKICRHAFVQFPTDLPITPENERMMLDQAVAFVNGTHGGNAVFWARLDRDEAGRHGVDVFYAPKYQKITKRGATTWISLTKFGKLRAVERFGEKPLERKNPETNVFEPVQDEHGNPVIVQCDSKFYQGRAFQDLWFEHLRDVAGLDWILRGDHKVGRDPDRLEVEEYKLEQERQRLEADRAVEITESRERLRLVEKAGNQAINARTDLLRAAQENASQIKARAEDDAERLVLEASQGLQRQQDVIDQMRDDLEARGKALEADAAQQTAVLSRQRRKPLLRISLLHPSAKRTGSLAKRANGLGKSFWQTSNCVPIPLFWNFSRTRCVRFWGRMAIKRSRIR